MAKLFKYYFAVTVSYLGNFVTYFGRILIANTSKYCTGTVINPDDQLDDGKFELVIVLTISSFACKKSL